ncbi:hypothetical protein KJ909_02320 [Patescibacteria group bacterium]|nr:hypothetical protein [Patescibacteria group bacterium]
MIVFFMSIDNNKSREISEERKKFVICPVDGKQFDITPRDWGDEMANLMGRRIVTAECPVCKSTLSVQEEEIKEEK